MKNIFLTLLFTCLSAISYSQHREIDSLKHILATTKEDTTRVLALVSIGYRSPGASALTVDEQALQLARKIKYEYGEARALLQFSNDFFAMNNYPKALEHTLQALKIFERINNTDGIAACFSSLSGVYYAQDDYNKSNYYLHRALATTTNSTVLKKIYMYLGRNFEALNKLDSALAYYQRSYEIFPDDDMGFANLLSYLGNVHARLGRTELAAAFYRTGIEKMVREKRGSIEFGKNYYGLASLFRQKGNIDSSIYYAKRSLEAAKHNPEMITKSSMLLSELYESTDHKQALYYYKLSTTTKDSIYNSARLLLLNNLSLNEEKRQKENVLKELKVEEERKHNLQYAAIAFGIITFVILFFALSHSIIANKTVIKFLGILALLIVFEFLNLFLHPFLDRISNHQPVIMLAAMVCLAALLIPLHHKLEHWITDKMVEKNKKIRLAAAKKTIATLEGEQIN